MARPSARGTCDASARRKGQATEPKPGAPSQSDSLADSMGLQCSVLPVLNTVYVVEADCNRRILFRNLLSNYADSQLVRSAEHNVSAPQASKMNVLRAASDGECRKRAESAVVRFEN